MFSHSFKFLISNKHDMVLKRNTIGLSIMNLPRVKAPFILPSRFKPTAGNIHKVLKWKFSFREGAGKNSKKAGLEELA